MSDEQDEPVKELTAETLNETYNVEEIEPWRKNQKLADSEDKLKEMCNSVEKYEPSFLFSPVGWLMRRFSKTD
jgi:hypothetical protein